jgi:hypothetical protein
LLVSCIDLICVFNQGVQSSVADVSPYGRKMTDLQHHVEFFDRNKDGIITIAESIEGACENFLKWLIFHVVGGSIISQPAAESKNAWNSQRLFELDVTLPSRLLPPHRPTLLSVL